MYLFSFQDFHTLYLQVCRSFFMVNKSTMEPVYVLHMSAGLCSEAEWFCFTFTPPYSNYRRSEVIAL